MSAFVARVTSSDARTDDETYALTVATGVSFVQASPPSGRVGKFYTYTFVGTGGATPYVFSFVDGDVLPPGLTLTASGVLSGRPTLVGSYPFTVTLTDEADASVSAAVTVTIRRFSRGST